MSSSERISKERWRRKSKMNLKNKIKKYDFVNVIVVADFDGNSEFGIIRGMRV